MLDESGARIILLVAPAGYGKTTLARQWLSSRNRPSTWYRGGPGSADVAALAVGIAEAAAQIVAAAGDRMRKRLLATERPEEDAGILAEMLAEDLVDWPGDTWLAIDDYHYVAESAAAEEFFESLVMGSGVSILMTSRRKPGWATARRRLYGEITEVDRTLLAMSDDEALQVLADVDAGPNFLRRASGWPAVIGLAALTAEATTPAETMPNTLYNYFADELYQAASPSSRQALSILAVSPRLTRAAADAILGANVAKKILEEAADIGILVMRGAEVEIHPLLREFLRGKLSEHGVETSQEAIHKVGRYLFQERAWDEAFALVEESAALGLMGELFEAALDDLLLQGRTATLRKWLDRAYEAQLQFPVMDLAEAEISFREGSHRRTEVLALTAARTLPEGHSLSSRAFALAGQAAFFEGRGTEALAHYFRAEEISETIAARRRALWGQFLTLVDLDDPEAESIFTSLDELEIETPEDILRLAVGRYQLALRRGESGLPSLLANLPVLSRSLDPPTRASFLNVVAAALVLAGRYDEASKLAAQQMEEAEKFRLAFALPHARLRKAAASLGLRAFEEAKRHLNRGERLAHDLVDPRLWGSIQSVKALTLVAQGELDEAASISSRSRKSDVSGSALAELRATHALVLACSGESQAADAEARAAQKLSKAIEPTLLGKFAIAISSSQREDPNTLARLNDAIEHAVRTDAVDCLVAAYRGYPEILKLVDHSHLDLLTPIMRRAHDSVLAKSIGLVIPAAPLSASGLLPNLSTRENEVLDLMSEGLTNRQIAERLFLGESTVKVHVRHIFEKLGVRTRTAAAALRRWE
jgi:LuxR family maltose regulon positive regulatory protein